MDLRQAKLCDHQYLLRWRPQYLLAHLIVNDLRSSSARTSNQSNRELVGFANQTLSHLCELDSADPDEDPQFELNDAAAGKVEQREEIR